MDSEEDGPSPAKRPRLDDNAETSVCKVGAYAKSYMRVTKDDLYMIIALWMQDFVDLPNTDKPSVTHKRSYHNVGAVLALPNDVIFAADCSRGGVHAVARLLMKHSDKAEGCKMFVSRKPCPTCAKLLVQSKVNRVLYLPFQEPEYYQLPKADNMMNQVDNMFTANAIAQTRFVFQVERKVLTDASSKKKFEGEDKMHIKEKKKDFDKYGFEGNKDWKEVMKEKLPWPAFDNDIDSQVQEYFDNAMEWMAQTMVLSGNGLHYDFVGIEPSGECKSKNFDPVNNSNDSNKARHFITIARFLAERTDDPKTGVGAVIVSPKMDILAFGWNGFPFKAYYSEFARASRKDPSRDKKFPYVIHAEQNAILMRNTKSFEDAILFLVNRSPCDECAPLIAMAGIRTVVFGEVERDEKREKEREEEGLGYETFPLMVKNDDFVCYKTQKRSPDDSSEGETSPSEARRKLP